MRVGGPGSERRGKIDPAEKLPKSLKTMGIFPTSRMVKRVVTIGVHGWFPNPRLKSVFGEPTGTRSVFSRPSARQLG
jgi:hypothetical protein